ncbi:zinc-dependent alcohol dehydrogenase [Diplocloster modestus]|uniref:Alcohol dehydrogenase catalytic domain-containing protein n=1 Tax=Diplocloster modestus TaxID=2850322 RepID=A0ABS6KBB8_9FIRM|nr:alcohol dehydrogenase catalytic domain-containing protein [Diplocloster modestus]MBU9727800.1 alcohol dehydrogenase catalytic domain-containing protein [Diplocloster modestus]
MGKMRAVVARGANEYSIEMMDIPRPGYGEVLCRVRSVAICGSDPGLFHGKYVERGWPPAYPFIFGHEWAGEVVELGEGVANLKVGDRVAGEAHSGCGICENCRQGFYTLCLNYGKNESGHRHYGFTSNGAYAEYGVFTEKSCEVMPDKVSFDEATMCDTGGVALQSLRMANVASCETVVIYGPGPIGNLAMQIARTKGAAAIMVGRGHRLEIAKKSGADFVVNYEACDPVEEVRKITNGRGADAAIEAAGTQTSVHNAIKSVRKNGRVSLIALTKEKDIYVPVNDIVCDQIRVNGSRANPNVSKEVLRLLEQGKIDTKHLITHTFDLEEIRHAIEIFENRMDGAMKVVIHP